MQITNLKTQLNGSTQDVEEARACAEVEKARFTSEEAKSTARRAMEETEKLKKDVELQINQTHQLKHELENSLTTLKLSQEDALKAKEEVSLYEEEKTRFEADLITSHAQK